VLSALGIRFVADESELEQFRLRIKLVACPHCGRSGSLIGHGWLTGYCEREPTRRVRGRRFFCSNRFRRPGCGHTFSTLFAPLLAGFVVVAHTLWRFIEQVTLGLSRKRAWEMVAAGGLSLSSAYRLWRRLRRAQSSLRTRLCRQCAAPACLHDEPLAQLLSHFGAVFPRAKCPFAGFQLGFQRCLFD
jgi:hypothetical protein